MKIRNRTADVVELRCHICQDFMKMIVVDNWRTMLYPFVQREITGRNKNNYIEQYKVIRQKGIDNYSFDDMDVPFIVNVLRYGPKIATVTKNTSIALNHITVDRHATSHSSENETEEELYLRALVSLRDLQIFLHTVDLNETTIPDEKRAHFVQKYSKSIGDLKLEIYNDCIEMFQIKKDIQLIISSDDQGDAFFRMYQSYNEKARLSDENRTHLWRFVIEASNAGIKSAHGYAATYYQNDLEEATRRYEMMIDGADKLSAHEAHQLIDFVNLAYMTGKKPIERMERFVKMVKDQGFCIEVTPDGIVWNKK